MRMGIPLFLGALLVVSPPVMVHSGEAYTEPALREKDRSHWAFQPLSADRGRKFHSIDECVLEGIRSIGIEHLAPRADPQTLLRRLHFHLTGLPPAPAEVESFSFEDYETTVDELLARPQYGEHWGQHWLDVARFAETDGFEHDKVRSEAWRYRDWVIDALNRDLPYDEFVSAQIAGDELYPGNEGARVATAFLFGGPDMPDINLEAERRHNVLNEATGAVGTAFLGLTLSCAQCHDHKSDPISQADFYRMRSFFENASLPPRNRSLPHFFSEAGPEVTRESFLRTRGDFRRSGPVLQPDFIRVANPGGEEPEFIRCTDSSGRRAALARWLTSPDHPLVSRVMVNRVWQHYFGRGIVETPDDFGTQGSPPSHPELLDWLSTDFVANGWSLKHLHRRILLSRTWQQASMKCEGDSEWEARLRLDPDNRALTRHSRIRLGGEAIRDAMLAASGDLNLKAGGPGFLPPLPSDVTVTLLPGQWPVTEDRTEHLRRSVYLFARRNLKYPLFDAFDRPDANLPCARRHLSTTATQSLILLNSEFSEQCAHHLARQLAAAEAIPDRRIRLASLLTVGRLPTETEKRLMTSFLKDSNLEEFALALFNRNEFVYLD